MEMERRAIGPEHVDLHNELLEVVKKYLPVVGISEQIMVMAQVLGGLSIMHQDEDPEEMDALRIILHNLSEGRVQAIDMKRKQRDAQG